MSPKNPNDRLNKGGIEQPPPLFSEPPRTVLVTGGARRIGRAICIDFAARGWKVALHYHQSTREAAETVAEITGDGGHAVALSSALDDEAAYSTLFDQAYQALGGVGCLINNASSFEHDDMETTTRESWDIHMEVNLRAAFVLSQQFIAQLPSDQGGNIINIIDQRVWNLTPFFTTYTLSKSGLWTLTQTMALALAPRFRVNAVGPGPTLPSRFQTAQRFQQQCQNLPLQRGTSSAEICQAIQFILASPSMTGQMIALDGGQHLGWSQTPQNEHGED